MRFKTKTEHRRQLDYLGLLVGIFQWVFLSVCPNKRPWQDASFLERQRGVGGREGEREPNSERRNFAISRPSSAIGKVISDTLSTK